MEGQFQITQKAFIRKNGRLLVLLTRGNYLDLPGGRVNENESDLLDSLRREVSEETKLTIDIGLVFHVWLYPSVPTLSVCYRCEYVSGDVCLDRSHKEAIWVSYRDLHRRLGSYYQQDYYPIIETYFKRFG